MILVSAGHHPSQPGARFGDAVEHDEAMLWVVEIARQLGGRGMVVPPGVLAKKVAFINERSPGIAVEVHFGDAPNEEHGEAGCEIRHLPGSPCGLALAEAIYAPLARLFPQGRGIRDGWYRGDPERGPEFFLDKTSCPAVIIEPEFIQRSDQIRERRADACRTIAAALLSYR